MEESALLLQDVAQLCLCTAGCYSLWHPHLRSSRVLRLGGQCLLLVKQGVNEGGTRRIKQGV